MNPGRDTRKCTLKTCQKFTIRTIEGLNGGAERPDGSPGRPFPRFRALRTRPGRLAVCLGEASARRP